MQSPRIAAAGRTLLVAVMIAQRVCDAQVTKPVNPGTSLHCKPAFVFSGRSERKTFFTTKAPKHQERQGDHSFGFLGVLVPWW
jgi:hypothetical protein